ncbi:hypothetical protein BDF22DRAFT_315148 [Syncephalis plumigaleata]|nr:hypothetical protein BDF22DRAFT_315148 [Syncephalis plumigaleata]
MLVLHQRRFGILIFCGSILFLFILQATLTFSEYVIQGQQSLRHDADLARKLYRREDNGGHTSNSGHGSEVATASVTHSQRGNKLHTINHNVHGDSDVPDGKGNGNSNPIAAAQGSPVENAHAHKPWLLFHSKHDNDQSMAHASNAEMNSSEEAEMAEDESLELDEGGMWFTMTALITGAFNFSSCIYIMIKTWPRASTDKSAKKRST